MDFVDVLINEDSLLMDYHCVINAVTITPLVKKQYLADVPGADGSRDLTVWFGAPRFEMRTLKIFCQSCSLGAAECAEKMINRWAGAEAEIRLSFEAGLYYTGIITSVTPSGAEQSDEICITISCNPYRYREWETAYDIPASEVPVSYIWYNDGTLDVVPELTVLGDDVVILMGTMTITMSAGSALVPALSIAGNSEITVEVSGGALQVRFREAIR